MAETLLLGLERLPGDFSVGPLSADDVAEIAAVAERHGFALARPKWERSY